MPRVLPSPAAPITSAEQDLRSPSRRVGLLAQQERHEHRQEAGEHPRPAVGAQREDDGCGIRVCGACPALRLRARRRHQHERALARAGVDLGGQPDREIGRDHEDARRRSAATTATRPWRRRPASGAEIAAPTIPASEIRLLALTSVVSAAGAGGRRRRGSRRTPWTTTRTPSAAGNSQRRVRGHGVGHHPAQERPQRHRRADRPAAAVAEPVEERADQRRDDRERQHRQPEEQRDLAARLAGRDLKNSVPASEIATAASPAALKACSSISRESPESPAPSALRGAARLADGVLAGPAGPRAAPAAPRPTAAHRPRRADAAGAGAGEAAPVRRVRRRLVLGGHGPRRCLLVRSASCQHGVRAGPRPTGPMPMGATIAP